MQSQSRPPVPPVPPIPPGFQEVKTWHEFNNVEVQVVLLVPSRACQELQRELESKKLEAAETVRALRAERDAEAHANGRVAISEEIKRRKQELSDEAFPKEPVDPEATALLEADKLPVHPRLHLQVYDPLAPLILGQKLKPTDRDVSARNKELFKTLSALGSYRRIVEPPVQLDVLFQLEEDYPHFREVIQFVRRQIIMARSLGKAVHIPPILLGGDPGLGKTHFTQALAGALGLPCRRQGMDAAVTGAAFMGSDKKWANTATGFLFNLICTGTAGEVPIANPVVLLDELDKTTQHNDSPLAPLHSLLEPISASRVRDLSVDIEFDCSQVIWIATANLLPRIPDSLRSRFREFWIELPTGKEAIQFAQGVVRETVKNLGKGEFAEPNRIIGLKLAHLTAREIYQAVEDGLARATENGRTVLRVQDIPKDALWDDPPGPDGGSGSEFGSGSGYLH